MRPAQAIRDQEEFPLMRRKRPRFVAARTCSTTFVIIVQSLPSLEGQERERIWHAVEVLAYIRVRVFVVLDRWNEGGNREQAGCFRRSEVLLTKTAGHLLARHLVACVSTSCSVAHSIILRRRVSGLVSIVRVHQTRRDRLWVGNRNHSHEMQ